jgi:hypothetical protein
MPSHKKPKKSKPRLPKEIIVIENPDKKWHEKWKKNRDELNIPHPFRAVLLGKPNSGKTLIMKNILARATPEFEEVLIVHCDPDETAEFGDVDCEVTDTIPSPTDLDPEVKRLVILEDLEYSNMDKTEKASLDRLFGYASTHKNTSVMLTAQDGFSIPAKCRRCCNLWVIWRTDDVDSLKTIGRRVGIEPKDFENMFDEHCPNNTDSLWVDMTDKTPYPLRINGYKLIDKPTKGRKVRSQPLQGVSPSDPP